MSDSLVELSQWSSTNQWTIKQLRSLAGSQSEEHNNACAFVRPPRAFINQVALTQALHNPSILCLTDYNENFAHAAENEHYYDSVDSPRSFGTRRYFEPTQADCQNRPATPYPRNPPVDNYNAYYTFDMHQCSDPSALDTDYYAANGTNIISEEPQHFNGVKIIHNNKIVNKKHEDEMTMKFSFRSAPPAVHANSHSLRGFSDSSAKSNDSGMRKARFDSIRKANSDPAYRINVMRLPTAFALETEKSLCEYRRGATRKFLPTTGTTVLRKWYFEHIDNPYPTAQEKHLLKKTTGLTLTQINNWLSNARRRLSTGEHVEVHESSEMLAALSPEHEHVDVDEPFEVMEKKRERELAMTTSD